MNCQRAQELFPELLDARLRTSGGSPDVEEARSHLASCPDCQREYAALSRTVAALDALPDPAPSPRLRRDFYALLEEEKHSAASVHAAATRRTHRLPWWNWLLMPVAACAFVAAGFVAGQQYRGPEPAPRTIAVADPETKRELQELRAKVDRMDTMNQFVAASFQRQQRPANERLPVVLTSNAQEPSSDRLINELIASLALDSSANVRLSALEALYPHAEKELVRTAVLASLPREANPVVQIAMIDFLAAARDREARPALEKLTVNEGANDDVRQAAKRALAQL